MVLKKAGFWPPQCVVRGCTNSRLPGWPNMCGYHREIFNKEQH